jgi:hypothetical protein
LGQSAFRAEHKPPAKESAEGIFCISEFAMREDMYKVIVERPRRGKYGYAGAARLRNDIDGPMRLGMRAGYGYRALNENLAPLRRFLHAQIGRPWNKVFSEICAGIDRRNTVQQHIHQHISDFTAIDVDVRNGRLVDLAADRRFLWNDDGIRDLPALLFGPILQCSEQNPPMASVDPQLRV